MSLSEKASFVFRLLRRLRRPRTAAVILAAGLGTRMQSEEGRTKQLLLLEGKPLFLYSVLAFDAAPCIDELVLVVRREEVPYVETVIKSTPLKKPIRVTVGGKTRQASARRGLEAVSQKMGYVAVHDAARCLITPEIIERVAKAAFIHRAASAGSPVTDTIKLVSEAGFVERTLDRNKLFRAQTPQIFEKKLYYAASYAALENKKAVTDDNMLLELVGQTVKMVDCGYENIKVTTKEDILFARAILRARTEETEE
jgi:2-C-methyl-D-erythritol 4-phosphate cytidylyltransferase